MDFGGKSESACGEVTESLASWTSGMLAVASIPGLAAPTCSVKVWAEGHGDASGRTVLEQDRIAGFARGDSVSDADAENSGEIAIDGGGGARFRGEWAWNVPRSTAAEVSGVVEVDEQAAYAGATLDIPGWAMVDVWEGDVDAWVRRGSEWVHVTGEAPMTIEFGAVVHPRGSVCAQGSATAGSHVVAGEGAIGTAGIHFSFDPAKSTEAFDRAPSGGPQFEPCGCE
jgi:hypothetical protein